MDRINANNKSKGLFITFEGIDGCGKTSMSTRLGDFFRSQGREVLMTREPGGSPLGKMLRAVLLEKADINLSSEAEALLFAADRAQHCRTIIAPALEKGVVVICDRFIDSTIAYQGGGRGLDIDMLSGLNSIACGDIIPDLTLYLSVPFEESLKRRGSESDRMEQEDIRFFERTASVYEKLALTEKRIVSIDASAAEEDVFAAVLQVVKERLNVF